MNKDNPTQNLLDLALHPVRMRILMLLSGSQSLTPLQMAERMSDVPQATLYRHINRLAQAGLLVVVADRPVRGTLEKVYGLNTAAQPAGQSLDAFNRISKEEHLRFFTTFALGLIDDFSRYIHHSRGSLDIAADGVGYHKLALYLSDEELAEMSAALNQALAPFLQLEETPGRRKRLFATVMTPAVETAGEPNQMQDRKDELK